MKRFKIYFYLIFGVIMGLILMYFFNHYTIEKVSETPHFTSNKSLKVKEEITNDFLIDELTFEQKVIDFVKENHHLPNYYITKQEARNQGWVASKGNLCEVLPGKAIGGDKFSNRERRLPQGKQYYEADVNYKCGMRNADRIVFTKKGEVWLTKDHYNTFYKQ